MAGRLEGKIAIVCGGGVGIGEAIAHKFAREGAEVVVAGLPGDPVEDVAGAVRRPGGEAGAFSGDLAEEAQAKACIAEALTKFGTLDVLIKNAGVPNVFAFVASDEASYMTGALVFADGGTTIARGGPGKQVESFVKEQPQLTLDLQHGRDGTRNKPVENRMH